MDWLKIIHVAAVAVSGTGFFARGVLMLRGSRVLGWRSVKVAPHVVDTILLASAILLALRLEQYPLTDAWVSAKVIGLVFYIGLGLVALRFGRTRRARVAAWVGARVVFGYIVSVAVTRSALGPF